MRRLFWMAMLLAMAAPALSRSSVSFECEDGGKFHALFDKDGRHAVLHFEGRVYELEREISASGEKFGDGRVILWTKGNLATLTLEDGRRFVDCPETAALSLDERRLLELPVRSTVEMEIAWFNDRLLEAAARGETWTLDSVQTALRFIDSPSAPYENITRVETPLENPRIATVTVVQGRLLDDSIQALRYRIEMERTGVGRWTLTGASRAQLCQRGPQMGFFAAEPCP